MAELWVTTSLKTREWDGENHPSPVVFADPAGRDGLYAKEVVYYRLDPAMMAWIEKTISNANSQVSARSVRMQEQFRATQSVANRLLAYTIGKFGQEAINGARQRVSHWRPCNPGGFGVPLGLFRCRASGI